MTLVATSSIQFSAVELKKFRMVHKQFWPSVMPLASRRVSWKKSDDDAIIIGLVAQVAVIGNSEAGTRLHNDDEAKSGLVWKGHLEGKSRTQCIREIHAVLRRVGARWAGKTVASCRFSPRIADSLSIMELSGGPRAFVASVARRREEDDRLTRLQDLPVFRGNKSPRDFLNTSLGLASWKVALDRRVLAVLREIAPDKIHEVDTPPRKRYLAIECALIEQVCPVLGANGFELDQLLYLGQGRQGRIVEFLRTGALSERAKLQSECLQC